MSNRLNQERERRLQPQRMQSCMESIKKMGFKPYQVDDTELRFDLLGNTCKLFPYSGWWSCKGIGSGRGFNKLLEKIEQLATNIGV